MTLIFPQISLRTFLNKFCILRIRIDERYFFLFLQPDLLRVFDGAIVEPIHEFHFKELVLLTQEPAGKIKLLTLILRYEVLF